MKKRHVPLGLPRRDSRHHRFALPNAIWEYKLKPVEFVIFSWLCYRGSHGQAGTLTAEVVAERVHLSENTVKKYLALLADRGLVTAEWSLTLDNRWINSKKFFTLPNEIFLLGLPPSAFMAYAYLLLIEDRRTHICHPSYNTIAAATGMAKNTVIPTSPEPCRKRQRKRWAGLSLRRCKQRKATKRAQMCSLGFCIRPTGQLMLFRAWGAVWFPCGSKVGQNNIGRKELAQKVMKKPWI